jgi:hypothetical protein
VTGRKKAIVFLSGSTRKAVLGRTRSARSLAGSVYDERRAGVYRADAEYADEDPAVTLPPRGPDRDALAERLRVLKADGATHLQAGLALGLEAGQVSVLCREYDIKSVTRAGRKKGYDPVPPGSPTSGVA